MAKKVLILGAGMVSRPMVKYLFDKTDYRTTMASRTVSKAEKIIDGNPKGTAIELNVKDDELLEKLVSDCDLAVSLLPYVYHPKVAELCIKHKKQMVTTSYVSDAMKALGEKAKNAEILILNECGLDPGIDHMSVMRVIHNIEKKGGKVISFKSSTGALPSHEANTNPFGYKFSWAPRGVLLASKNPSKWLQDGKEVSYPGEQLFENYYIQDVPGIGSFENYPNRNSVPYKDIYGLKDTQTVYRGTFRMTGWCETMREIVALDWLNDKPIKDFSGETYGDMTRYLVDAGSGDDIVKATAKYLGLETYSTVIKRLEWLGLFSDKILPKDKDNPLDYMNVLTLKKMSLLKDERDMIVMHHEFIAKYPDKKEYITSTLVDYGIPNDDSSVARTVSIPTAIATKMILEGKINITGVHIPVIPEIYNTILDELEEMNIKFSEKVETL
ncbi:MAG: saccharopine dehydrogenase C-terminal domain-containing protein [Candidatus Thermoplasmatota archaeon]|nr:saccharopine dehydrogenase C-terminal domain-containing protein [Candidatus Thermoplasmatota archaeon]